MLPFSGSFGALAEGELQRGVLCLDPCEGAARVCGIRAKVGPSISRHCKL